MPEHFNLTCCRRVRVGERDYSRRVGARHLENIRDRFGACSGNTREMRDFTPDPVFDSLFREDFKQCLALCLLE